MAEKVLLSVTFATRSMARRHYAGICDVSDARKEN